MYTKYNELEYKYRADHIDLNQFREVVGDISVEDSYWDIYYENDQGQWIRERDGTELTIKQSINGAWNRIEVDLRIMSYGGNETEKFCNMLGYSESFRIFKTAFIKQIGDVVYSYYAVYDEAYKSIGRFIELEVDKDVVTTLGEECVDKLFEAENQFNGLITPKDRLNKSLFEIVKGR